MKNNHLYMIEKKKEKGTLHLFVDTDGLVDNGGQRRLDARLAFV